jgi:hypothetical protein
VCGRCVCERDVNSGLETGGISSESSESEPSDGLKVNGSWSSSSSLSSTDAAPEVVVLRTGESGLVIEFESGGGRWRGDVCRDRNVGRFGVDLDCKPGGTPRLGDMSW